jgi:hypothetical protein
LSDWPKTDLIQREDVEVLRQRIDVRRPPRAVAAEAVQQHDRRAAAGFEVVQLEPEHGGVLGSRRRPRLSRRAEDEDRDAAGSGEALVQHAEILASRTAICGILFGCDCSDCCA